MSRQLRDPPGGFAVTHVDRLFFTPLVTFRLADAEQRNPLLLQEIADLRRSDAGVGRSNRGGWHSRDDLFSRTEPGLAALARELAATAHEATRLLAPNTDFGRLRLECEGWINVNPPGSFNAPHDHPGWYWSGAYYVAVPEAAPDVRGDDPTEGCIEFLDGRTNLRALSPIDAPCMHSKVTLRPEAGMLVLFPSHLRHWVYPNRADQDRVSVAFNARFSSTGPGEHGSVRIGAAV